MNAPTKQLLEAWIKYTLFPIVEGAIKSRIPLSSIASALAAAAVRAAVKSGTMTLEDLQAVVADSWGRQSKG